MPMSDRATEIAALLAPTVAALQLELLGVEFVPAEAPRQESAAPAPAAEPSSAPQPSGEAKPHFTVWSSSPAPNSWHSGGGGRRDE